MNFPDREPIFDFLETMQAGALALGLSFLAVAGGATAALWFY